MLRLRQILTCEQRKYIQANIVKSNFKNKLILTKDFSLEEIEEIAEYLGNKYTIEELLEIV